MQSQSSSSRWPAALLSALPPFNLIHGWSIDALTALRWELFGARRDPAAAPVAVIAIDEETYRDATVQGLADPDLDHRGRPGADRGLDGGAKVVGFDIVFPTSIEQSEIPFGDDSVGAKMRGFDRPFLRALAAGTAAGKVVLGEALRADGANRPSPGSGSRSAGRKTSARSTSISDPDDVVRRVPLTFRGRGKPIPSMALELASRALTPSR